MIKMIIRRSRSWITFIRYLNLFMFILVEPVRLQDEPIGEEQQALLAEFERRRRVKREAF